MRKPKTLKKGPKNALRYLNHIRREEKHQSIEGMGIYSRDKS